MTISTMSCTRRKIKIRKAHKKKAERQGNNSIHTQSHKSKSKSKSKSKREENLKNPNTASYNLETWAMMFGGGGGSGENDQLGLLSMSSSMMASPSGAEISPKERGFQQQQPQWGQQETKEFIVIRGELETDFTVAKRNKTLWEIVSGKMRERGYRRTPEQCKWKWKNLVNRYKGKETSDPENGRQCPFFEELHAVFTERAKNVQQLLLESEAGSTQTRKRVKKTSGDKSSDEFSEDEDECEDDSDEEQSARSNSRKRKGEKLVVEKPLRAASSSPIGGIQEMLKEFFLQQQQMEMQWREMMERRARERQLLEQEWRQSMQKLERERLMIEQAWREREEQRRMREEGRAERRDALLTTLLNQLIHENNK